MAKARKKASKRRSKAKKNPALISAKELGYFYEDGIRDFNGSALVGQNLSNMVLRGAQFRDANLYNVNFSGADLRGVDFRGADLGDTDFRGAMVDMETSFEGVNLKGSKGPPQYYRGDMKITPQEMFGHASGDAGVAPFGVEQTDEGFMVVVDPSSGLAGSIKPKSFDSVIEAMDHASSLNREAQGLGDSPGQVQDYEDAVRTAKAKIKEVEALEPTIRGRHLDEVLSVMDMVVEDFRGSRGTAIRDYTAVSPAVAPLYVMGSLQFSDPDKGQEFLDSLAELGLRMPYTAGAEAKALIPIDELDAAEWSDYLRAYNLAKELLDAARAGNPGKRRAPKTPEYKRLINRSQKLWEKYDEKPLKKHLIAFGDHIEKMKAHTSARVRSEARRGARAFNAEFRARGWKKPVANPKKKATKKAKKKATKRKNPPAGSPLRLEDDGGRSRWPDRRTVPFVLGTREERTAFTKVAKEMMRLGFAIDYEYVGKHDAEGLEARGLLVIQSDTMPLPLERISEIWDSASGGHWMETYDDAYSGPEDQNAAAEELLAEHGGRIPLSYGDVRFKNPKRASKRKANPGTVDRYRESVHALSDDHLVAGYVMYGLALEAAAGSSITGAPDFPTSHSESDLKDLRELTRREISKRGLESKYPIVALKNEMRTRSMRGDYDVMRLIGEWGGRDPSGRFDQWGEYDTRSNPKRRAKKRARKKPSKRRRKNPGVSDSVVEDKAENYRISLETVRGDEVALGMWPQIMGARQEITSFARDWSKWRDSYDEYYPGWSQENFQYYETLLPTLEELRIWHRRQYNPYVTHPKTGEQVWVDDKKVKKLAPAVPLGRGDVDEDYPFGRFAVGAQWVDELPNRRPGRGVAGNPKKKAKKRPWASEPGKSTLSDKEFWSQVKSLKWPTLRKGPVDWGEQRDRLLKKKPMAYWDEFYKKADEKRKGLTKQLDLGVNDFAWDFSADVIGHGKRMYDRMMTDEAWATKQLDSEKYGIENFFYMFPTLTTATWEQREVAERETKKPARKTASKRKATKKKAKKRGRQKKNPRRVSKANFIVALQKTLDEFREGEKILMADIGVKYRDPLADTVIREEGNHVMLHYDGAGYDYLSMNSDYDAKLRQKLFDKAESLGWEADDYSSTSMEFFPG